jgi:hypothetical protein
MQVIRNVQAEMENTYLLTTKEKQPIFFGKNCIWTFATIAHDVLICEKLFQKNVKALSFHKYNIIYRHFLRHHELRHY